MSSAREPWCEALDDAELERQRDVNARAAESLLFGVGHFEDTYSGDMAAAAGHATLALLFDNVLARRHANSHSRPEEAK